ncbi:fam-d protein [Plasmodium chabaudi chabaudi]|uniref:Fam-d protein n=1 Tax=Plasmodium chabaudi chabaudi TaxID=31271 RepID=A0A4V0K8N6_PLACU|nr:fam-d protein [Plasmodium chabaudi chabaudi]VTZ68878.1 fam-d protein [Plasmodium chabaudi chabaudi]|eukprot:XP_739170.2 fam-d protein [Plasmodium chabaudi chabaudi]
MMKIIFSLFILSISANVKAASYQSGNPNKPQLISYDSVAHPTALFEYPETKHYKYLDLINDVLSKQSENTRYAFEGGNYHMVLTDFDISIDNEPHYVNEHFSKKGTEIIKEGTAFFIAYLKEKLKYISSHYMYKYDFENNYASDLMEFAHDLKAIVYDRFAYEYKHNFVKFRHEPEDKKLREKARDFFVALMKNSAVRIQGYFIKTRTDESFMYLSQDASLYFTVAIAPFRVNATYDFGFPEFEVVHDGSPPLKKLRSYNYK